MATLINLMLINNLFDNTLCFEVLMSGTMFSSIIIANLKDPEEFKSRYTNWVASLVFALSFFRVFLYIQKRVHKEIFFEMKQRLSEQDEFKTIFNELDEGIFIT